ncbi:MAG TPA: sodium:solute symporter family protein [Streptosporangiaceae bacterium]
MTLAIATAIVLATVAGSLVYGTRYRRGTVSDWAIGGRRFGSVIFWFMNAGEVYTTFAILGISGYAYAAGAPAYIAFTSVSLSYALGYWLMPRIWHAGRRAGLITQADYFERRFGSRALGVVAALVGIAALLVYVQIQLTGLSLMVSILFGTALPKEAAVIIAAVLMVAYVLATGLRSAAFAAAVKDVLMIVIVLVLAFAAAHAVGLGSISDVFATVQDKYPGIGSLPGYASDPADPAMGPLWFATSALSIALGNWVFPHLFQVSFAARDVNSIRRNAVWQPLYSLAYFFIVLLGFAALLAVPGLKDSNAALLTFVAHAFPAWLVGVVAGAGILLAIAPGSVLLLSIGTLVARNVYGAVRRDVPDRTGLRVSRAAMIVAAAVAVLMTLADTRALLTILLYAYSAIGQLAPAVILSFLWRRITAWGAFAGIVAGFAALLAPPLTDAWQAIAPGIDNGFVALLVNAAVTVLVSLVTRAPSAEAVSIADQSLAIDEQSD